MAVNKIVSTYLETIAKLTKAIKVNACFHETIDFKSTSLSCYYGKGLLPEFNMEQSLSEYPKLKRLVPTDKSVVVSVVSGEEKHSILIYYLFIGKEGFSNSLSKNESNVNTKNRRKADRTPIENNSTLCLGLTFDNCVSEWIPRGQFSSDYLDNNDQFEFLKILLQLGVHLFEHVKKTNALLSDNMTSLSGRLEFQSNLTKLISDYPVVAVLLVSPRDFQNINKKYGHENGDKVIWEIAKNLSDCLRSSDLLSRFGGALFAIAVPLQDNKEIDLFANKIRKKLQQREYNGCATALNFCMGAAVVEHSVHNQSSAEKMAILINNADSAFHDAQTDNEYDYVLWHQDDNKKEKHQQDYIGGIFTADTATDYSNMLLLWDISNLIVSYNKFDILFSKVAERLAQTFDFNFVGIIANDSVKGNLSSLTVKVDEEGNSSRFDLSSKKLEKLLSKVSVLNADDDYSNQNIVNKIVFQTTFSESSSEMFFMVGKADHLILPNDSILLLTALVKQLGRAKSRLTLEEELNQNLQHQKQSLQTELDELKQSVQNNQLHYKSDLMTELMHKAYRTAMTNTTTLIIGESGTGKGRLVQAMHEHGERRNTPLVVVDCGAIPETLIESELFGHVKGAFTGAQNSFKGRIIEADKGTLMLDEIGELPLLVQSKLLRFVQEKEFIPVGATKLIKVDVKIIAVTNRELKEEVLHGRFRQDLYYRLNVLTLRTPALRERPVDIPLLSKYFLHKYSVEHSEEIKSLSEQTVDAMLKYSWPGNIRELENRLLQATVLCDNKIIELEDLNIDSTPREINFKLDSLLKPTSPTKSNEHKAIKTIEDENHIKPASQDYLKDINHHFSKQVESIIIQSLISQAPLGRWLEDDLIQMTYDNCDQNARKAALRLGIPHSTLRRKIKKISHQNDPQSLLRTAEWEGVMNCLLPVISSEITIAEETIKYLKLELLKIIIIKTKSNVAHCSAIMGISEPTYYKLKNEIEQ